MRERKTMAGRTRAGTRAQPKDPWSDLNRRVRWIKSQFRNLVDYMYSQGLEEYVDRLEPVYQLPPYVALWRPKPLKQRRHRLWVITGDLPTDCLQVPHPITARGALLGFAEVWRRAALLMLQGKEAPDWTLRCRTQKERRECGELLLRRATLMRMTADSLPRMTRRKARAK